MTTALQLMTAVTTGNPSTSRFRHPPPSYCAKVLSTAQWRRLLHFGNNSGMPRALSAGG